MGSDPGDKRDRISDYDLLDEALVRYGGTDSRLQLADGETVDLNALADPFTGEERGPGLMTGLSSPADDERRAASQARIGRRLQALREDAGLTKREVATRAGVSPARITRVERGEVELGLALVSALVRAIGATVSDIAHPDAPEVSNQSLQKIAEQAGASREVVSRIRTLVPPPRFPDALERGFGWRRDELFAGKPQSAPPDVAVAFKLTPHGGSAAGPMLALARRLSRLSAGLHTKPFSGIPSDPDELRQQALTMASAAGAQDVTLDTLLRWAWNAGIVVLPMRGSGEFLAAVWLVGERPVIVLKDARSIAAYWLFDLAHELAHLALGHVATAGIVEVGEIESSELTDQQERDANQYALRLLLPDPEAMLAEVRRRTGKLATHTFKFKVEDVAKEAGIAAGVLGLVAAREMSDVPRDIDRWGSANNLAKAEDPDGGSRVRAEFARRVDPADLEDLDAALLRAASLPET